LGILVSGLGGVSVVARVVWRAPMVREVTGSRRMIISADEAAKVTSTDQFFYFILECLVVFCSVPWLRW